MATLISGVATVTLSNIEPLASTGNDVVESSTVFNFTSTNFINQTIPQLSASSPTNFVLSEVVGTSVGSVVGNTVSIVWSTS